MYSQAYYLSGDGWLRQVIRTNADGSTSSSIYFSGGEGVREERNTTRGITLVVRYDENGRTVGKERWEGEELSIREQYVFRDKSNILESSTETLFPKGTITEKRYDEKGQILTETTTEDAKVVAETDYSWDDRGHNTSKRRRSPEGIEEWRYFYDESGALAKEDYYRKGTLEKSTVYTGDKERYEELYKNGEMFLRTFYKGDAKVKEEVYEKGQLIRERSFQ
jgi:hypothetical protein